MVIPTVLFLEASRPVFYVLIMTADLKEQRIRQRKKLALLSQMKVAAGFPDHAAARSPTTPISMIS